MAQAESASAVYGRGISALIATFAGFMWCGWGFSALPNHPATIAVANLLMAVALMAFAVKVARRSSRMMEAEGLSPSDFWRKKRKRFGVVVILEFVGCILVFILLGAFHHPEWTATGISIVVGLHFFPLARIFESATYYWVGSLMVGWGILTVLVLKSWNLTASAGFASGAILWAAAMYHIARSLPNNRIPQT